MSEPFLAQITMFAGNFAPRSWAYCSGQILPIAQNTALFSLLGTTYGGDGRTTFGLPDLRGRVPVGSEGNSAGPGLTPRSLGQRSGSETNTLTTTQLPAHTHGIPASSEDGEATSPVGNSMAVSDDRNYINSSNANMASTANTGGGQAVNNMPPFLAINFIIAIQGLFPSRN